MRPALKAGLLPVWRDRDTLQIGIDPRRAIALTGIGQAAAVVSLLDGSRDWAGVIRAARDYGVPAESADRVLALLAAAGALHDFPAKLLRELPGTLRARLAPELATASLAYGDGDGGARILARRRMAFVRVYGAARIGSCVASLLAASGVGRLACEDPGTARPCDLTPAGLGVDDLDTPRERGAARAIRRVAPDVRTDDGSGRPDLAVLTGDTLTGEAGAGAASSLMHDHVPHLAVRASEAVGVVGPLVVPGRSACLRCMDLTRAERDPAWPLILAQAAGARCEPQACDTVLAAMTGALAAAQALAFIDRAGSVPAVTNGTLELVLPGWAWRRRTWLPHPGCTCNAASRPRA
jgi:bacteriocin biosynthesis cyclodehydratase domain-containing protein